MIMNKKIFTLLAGALMLLGSSFMVNAQRTVPYIDGTSKSVLGENNTRFYDILTADTVHSLGNPVGRYYVISVTGLANPDGPVALDLAAKLSGIPNNPASTITSSIEKSFVLYMDSMGSIASGDYSSSLRLEELSKLDTSYTLRYNGSNKFGAIRHASWCVKYGNRELVVGDYSRTNFEFTNLQTGLALSLPASSYMTDIFERNGNGYRDDEGFMFGDSLNMYNSEFYLKNWQFSHVYRAQDPLQKGMPLYQYTNSDDSVAVLVLQKGEQRTSTTGEVIAKVADDFVDRDVPQVDRVGETNHYEGYTVTVKIVSLTDLIVDAAGRVRLGSDGVSNVLLFTLKQINQFVMNANDWNAVDLDFGTVPDANVTNNTTIKRANAAHSTYLNPFTKNAGTVRALYAEEVNDSLYHYGYMNFKFNDNAPVDRRNQWLYVDTAFANEGNTNTLAFNWGLLRRDSSKVQDIVNPTALLWGHGFGSVKTTTDVNPFQNRDLYNYDGNVSTNDGGSNYSDAIENADGYGISADSVLFAKDSAVFIWKFMKDSIMENQAKFRVVYNPNTDVALVNVYQTRVRHNYWPNGTGDGQSRVAPSWWENSFWVDTVGKNDATVTAARKVTLGQILRPSDYWTGFTFAGTPLTTAHIGSTISGTIGVGSGDIFTAARAYYDDVIMERNGDIAAGSISRLSDDPANSTIGYFDMHGAINAQGSPYYNWNDANFGHGGFNFHSAMFASRYSEPTYMDRVMISTADTVSLYMKFTKDEHATDRDWSALGHKYGTSTSAVSNVNNTVSYRKHLDSLFYVDIQQLGSSRIISLDQSYEHSANIKLQYGPKCDAVDVNPSMAYIPNDLYLIRNARGQYLCVPLWSATDSAYWVMPSENEDPTRMPCYQWAVVGRTSTSSVFTITNREFENVKFEQVYLPYSSKTEATKFQMQASKAYSFNKEPLYGNVSSRAYDKNPVNARDFDEEMEKKEPLTNSFIRLSADVKSDQLLGYTYVDPDETIVDVYAFKYLHGNAMGNDARYISWNGYDNAKDTFLHVQAQNQYDKLFFELQPLDWEILNGHGNGLSLNKNSITEGDTVEYADLYNNLAIKDRRHTTVDSVFFEKFGYFNFDKKDEITDLKPLARQAYRLFLKDYYKWHPTVKGHYMTLGGVEDNYVLADRMHATRGYVKGSYDVSRLFGIPHFYFRDTYFDVQASGDDYFALLQRLDTTRISNESVDLGEYTYYTNPGYEDVEEYLTYRFGGKAAKKVLDQLKTHQQHAAFVALVEPYTTVMKMVRRGEAARNVSTFQLEKDEDPIYRHFHVNEPNEDFRTHMGNEPDTLVFHTLNQGDAGFRLYENSGSYKSPINGDRHGPEGGRVYNYIDGDYMRDTLNHVISFLGINVSTQFPTTNYSIYLDTAYIERGTGWIKPQYMMVVDPYKPEEDLVCDDETNEWYNLNGNYVLGRYLYNTSMYAKEVEAERENFNRVQKVNIDKRRNPNGKAYAYHNGSSYSMWERLAFAWAIHKGDSLYVLKGSALEPLYNNNYTSDSKDVWQKLANEYGDGGSVDFDKLISLSTAGTYSDVYYNGEDTTTLERDYREFKGVAQHVAEGRTIGLHAIIALDDNTHKDWVFSFRYVERGASDFVIESETTDRDTKNGAVIRPGYGGWVKFDNGVPVITRSDENLVMAEAYEAVFNVKAASDYYNNGNKKNPVDNQNVSSFTVIGGTGNITILNAANKNVVITNVLGQVVANTVLSSENATISVPAGVVIVSVAGENAVKAVVK